MGYLFRVFVWLKRHPGCVDHEGILVRKGAWNGRLDRGSRTKKEAVTSVPMFEVEVENENENVMFNKKEWKSSRLMKS